jgi:methylated-DNA-[protein]-cysteine S-methyltransferase
MNEMIRAREENWLGDRKGEITPDELLRSLDRVYAGPPPERIKAAVARASAYLEGELKRTLYYDRIEAPLVGKLYLALSSAGLYALTFGGTEADFVQHLLRSGRWNILRDPERVRPIAEQIQRYLAGEQSLIDAPVDMSGMTSFQRLVLGAVRRVPRGKVVTYGELAARIGRPKAARAVGRALGSNPIPIVIPCHRVLAADGSLGGYSGRGGVRTKRALLQLEGAL